MPRARRTETIQETAADPSEEGGGCFSPFALVPLSVLLISFALAFLAWFVFAPQCMSTIAVTRRETNGWKWPGFMLLYLFALAYIFAGITYWSAVALGL